MPPHHARTNFTVSIVHAKVPGPQAMALKEKQCNYNVALERPGTFILCRLSASTGAPPRCFLPPYCERAGAGSGPRPSKAKALSELVESLQAASNRATWAGARQSRTNAPYGCFER
jgi:hypothetical protein